MIDVAAAMPAATTQALEEAMGVAISLDIGIFAVSLGTNRSPIELAKDWGAAWRNIAASG